MPASRRITLRSSKGPAGPRRDLVGSSLGKWTEDTARAVAIAEVSATDLDLRSPAALDGIAHRGADWYAAADIR
jgi:hypothetical protein